MSKKRTAIIVILAFMVGVIVAFSVILILSKREISVDNYEEKTDYMGTVIIDGYMIMIPNKYKAAVDDDLGLVYSDNGNFEMSISVLDASYDMTVRELDSLDDSLREWTKLMKPFSELAVGKNSYIYGVYQDEGEIILLAYMKASEEKVFDIMVRCLAIDDMKFQTEDELIRQYENYILIANSLLDGAVPTDAENTPSGTVYVADDMYHDVQMVVTETWVSYDSLYDEHDQKLVSYDIADKFYMIAKEIKPGIYSKKVYSDESRGIVVTVIAEKQRKSDTDAKSVMKEGKRIWTDYDGEPESIEINGKSYYYYSYTEEYKVRDEMHEKYYFEAATDMQDGMIYRISGFSDADGEALDIATYDSFLTIEEP